MEGRTSRTWAVQAVQLLPGSPPTQAALAAALLFGLFLLGRLAFHSFDPSTFILVGERQCSPTATSQGLALLPGLSGYDGQYYYRLALDPFTNTDEAFGLRLDEPSYRQQRILYPFLAWLVSLGRPELAPQALLLVNWAALTAIAWLGAHLVAQVRPEGNLAIWGLAFALCPGFVLTLSRDLTEAVEAAFLLAGLLALARKRLEAGLLLALAVLARETALLIPVAGLMVEGWRVVQRRGLRPGRLMAFFLPILIWAGWQAWLTARWGVSPTAGGGRNLGPPLAGVLGLLWSCLPPPSWRQWIIPPELAFIALTVAAVLGSMRRSVAAAEVKVAWLMYLGLASVLTGLVWVEDWAFLRALTEFFLLGLLILAGGANRLTRLVLVLGGVLTTVLLLSRLLFL